jgi:hypothetical protein
MAEQENISELENVVNPDPSTREDSMEGRMDLVQAVVADQGFIAKLSSAIMAQMASQLLNKSPQCFKAKTQMFKIQEYLKIKRLHIIRLFPEYYTIKRVQKSNQIPPYHTIGRVQLY